MTGSRDNKNAAIESTDLPGGFAWQADHAEKGGAPATARVVRAMIPLLSANADTKIGQTQTGQTQTVQRMCAWTGSPIKDALPLRLAGGLHHLVLTGIDTRLAEVYAERVTDQGAVDQLVADLVTRFDEQLLPWLDGPPQTNEAGRSASIMAGLAWLCERVPARFEMLELGASAGINTMMERYFFRLGEAEFGPPTSPMQIAPEWLGAPLVPASPEIASIRGCDVAPIDLLDEASALRLKSYVWPEAAHRLGRIDAAVKLAGESPPDVRAEDAARFTLDALARPQASGLTRVLFHSIVWQYIPEVQQQRIEDAMAKAGSAASAQAPLVWLMLETNRETFKHELTAQIWDGSDRGNAAQVHLLAEAHPHGAWINWLV